MLCALWLYVLIFSCIPICTSLEAVIEAASSSIPVSKGDSYTSLLQAFGDAFNAHDAPSLASMMTEDCTFFMAFGPTGSPDGTAANGPAEVQQAFQSTFENFPDATWASRGPDFVAQTADGMWRGASVWTFKGTRRSDGAVFDTNGVDIFTLRDGKIWIKDAFRKDVPPAMV